METIRNVLEPSKEQSLVNWAFLCLLVCAGEGAARCRWLREDNLIFDGCYFLNPVNFLAVVCCLFIFKIYLLLFNKKRAFPRVCGAGEQLILALGVCAMAACAGMEVPAPQSHACWPPARAI